jgi:hypothetical protein
MMCNSFLRVLVTEITTLCDAQIFIVEFVVLLMAFQREVLEATDWYTYESLALKGNLGWDLL